MPGPLIFIGTHSIQEGRLDAAREASIELGAFLEANHPRAIHFQIYIDDDAREMKVVQIHPDDDSLLFHTQVAGDRIRGAYEFLEGTTSIEIYGTPGEELAHVINQMSMGAPVKINSTGAGFSRLAGVAA